MTITTGSYKLGPDIGRLSVRTKKAGAASKAGHNLLIEVDTWTARLDVGADGAPSSVELTVDSRSLRVIEGSGGVSALGDDDKVGIKQTIDDEVLKGSAIAFRSTSIDGDRVTGELELAGRRHPISFELTISPEGHINGAATVKQSNWGIKPYTALFGTLKVVDEVKVEVTARLPNADHQSR